MVRLNGGVAADKLDACACDGGGPVGEDGLLFDCDPGTDAAGDDVEDDAGDDEEPSVDVFSRK
jgi:hypothetical protein